MLASCRGCLVRLGLTGLVLFSACGDKKALKVPECPTGQHDGGGGSCVREGTCSDGFFDDGTGACAPLDIQSGEADLYLPAWTSRQLDMVFMIDNTPGMAPKVAKMNKQLPKLIETLKDPTDGTLPDLRVALINSDLGSAGTYLTGGCASKMLPDGTQSIFGDLGRFQMPKEPSVCTFEDGARFLEYEAGRPVNYSGDITTVLACMTGNLGTSGCDLQHQIQAFEFALAAKGLGNEDQQKAFLRDDALLALVFLTDEDDCSVATNDGLFGDFAEARGEAGDLRCATRAHQCGGRNLADAPPGYPTTASFSHPFKDCHARMGDECTYETDTSQPTSCNPLKSIKLFAVEMKALKAAPDNQILVAGIFGWPLDDSALERAEYKIAPLPNYNPTDTQHPMIYDYWPICYEPDHLPSNPDPATGFDGDAAGWGATGGLRLAAFVDEFGGNGLKFSICQRDFASSMSTIGRSLARMLRHTCVGPKLADIDASTAGVQPDCTVSWRYSAQDPADPNRSIWYEGTPPLTRCPAGATSGSITESCWRLVHDEHGCPSNGQLLEVLRAPSDAASLAPGTKIHARCRVCPDLAAPGCDS